MKIALFIYIFLANRNTNLQQKIHLSLPPNLPRKSCRIPSKNFAVQTTFNAVQPSKNVPRNNAESTVQPCLDLCAAEKHSQNCTEILGIYARSFCCMAAVSTLYGLQLMPNNALISVQPFFLDFRALSFLGIVLSLSAIKFLSLAQKSLFLSCFFLLPQSAFKE